MAQALARNLTNLTGGAGPGIPIGTESVNGSRVDVGCKDLVQKLFCGDGSESFLTDDHDPVINTTDRNWASQLVTVRKNNLTYHFDYDHVIMSFFSITCIIDINQTEPVQVSSVAHWTSKHHCVCKYRWRCDISQS